MHQNLIVFVKKEKERKRDRIQLRKEMEYYLIYNFSNKIMNDSISLSQNKNQIVTIIRRKKKFATQNQRFKFIFIVTIIKSCINHMLAITFEDDTIKIRIQRWLKHNLESFCHIDSAHKSFKREASRLSMHKTSSAIQKQTPILKPILVEKRVPSTLYFSHSLEDFIHDMVCRRFQRSIHKADALIIIMEQECKQQQHWDIFYPVIKHCGYARQV